MTKQDGRKPDRGADSNGGHIRGAYRTGHNSIYKSHRGLGHLSKDDRDRKGQQLTRFC